MTGTNDVYSLLNLDIYYADLTCSVNSRSHVPDTGSTPCPENQSRCPLMRRTITHASRNSCAEIALQGASPQALASRIALSVWFLLCWRTRTTLSVLLGMLSSFQLTKPSSSASSSVRLRAACRLAGCCSYSSSRLSRASALGPPPQRAAYPQHPSHRSQPGLTATCLCPRMTRSPSRRACRST